MYGLSGRVQYLAPSPPIKYTPLYLSGVQFILVKEKGVTSDFEACFEGEIRDDGVSPGLFVDCFLMNLDSTELFAPLMVLRVHFIQISGVRDRVSQSKVNSDTI